MIPSLADHLPLYAAVVLVLAVLVAARRIPVIRGIVNLAITLAMIGLLVVVIGQRGQFNPYLGRVAAWLDLDDQKVVGDEVRIRLSSDGHFWARVSIDGVQRRMLIDSGATVTALSTDTASAAGLHPKDEVFPIVLRTANGAISAQSATVGELRFGSIVARDLAVVVSPAFGDTNVLGMNFLSRLKSWRVEEGVLILVPHHPQDDQAT